MDNNIFETKKKMITRFLHYNMAAFGGFLGCYAVMLRADFLGNAQTSNLLYLVISIIGRDINQFLLRVGALLLYVSAAMLFVIIKKKTNYNIKLISLIIDLGAVITLSLLPVEMNPILALYPIFFAMSFQWNSFPGEYGYASSTIFSTNNLRQVSLSIAEYLVDKEKKSLHKAIFFAGTLLGFHLGIAIAYVSVNVFGVKATLVDMIFLVTGSILLFLENRCTDLVDERNFSTKTKNEGNYANINCNNA